MKSSASASSSAITTLLLIIYLDGGRAQCKHRIAEIRAINMKRLSKVEAAKDPSDGTEDE
jgi:hypothetical protein